MDLFHQPHAGRDDGRDRFSPAEIQHLLVMLNHLSTRFSVRQMHQIMSAVLQNEGLQGLFILSATTREVVFHPKDGPIVKLERTTRRKARPDRSVAARPRRIIVPFAFDCPEPSVN